MKHILSFILILVLGLLITLIITTDLFLTADENINNNSLPNELDYLDNDNYEEPYNDNGNNGDNAVKDYDLTIALYAGIGVWDDNVNALINFLKLYAIDYDLIYENELADEYLLKQYDIIWFPGGYAAEYRYGIKYVDHIRTYVENGGIYIGICAGAYYAADIFIWKGEEYDYPFNLYKGSAIGPLRGNTGWGHPVELILEESFNFLGDSDSNIIVYYYDGPYFSYAENEPVTVIARYLFNHEPAIIAGSFGQGKYLLLGPHPELGAISDETDQPGTDGTDGAKWPWLYSLLRWILIASN